jgi:hypothetical protein
MICPVVGAHAWTMAVTQGGCRLGAGIGRMAPIAEYLHHPVVVTLVLMAAQISLF